MRTLLRRARRSDRGFTLIELLIVIVILGVLAAIVVFAVSAFNDRGVAAACQADRKTVEVAVEAYRAQNNTYPNSETGDPSGWAQLVDGGFLREAPSSNEYQIHLGENGEVSGCDGAAPEPSASTTTEPGGGGVSPSPSASSEPAGAVSGITLSAQTATSVHVSWNAPTSGGYYNGFMIWLHTPSGGVNCDTPFEYGAFAYTGANTTETNINLSAVPAGSYYMCVQAIYDDAVNNPTGSLDGPRVGVPITKASTGPAAPTGLNVTSITATGAQISWNSVSGANGYQVRLNGGSWVDDNASPYSASGLSANTSYTVEVRARSGTAGNYTYGTPSSTTFVTLPNTPTGASAQQLSSSWNVRFSWNAPSGGAHHYEVQWSYQSNFNNATTINPATSPVTLTNPNHNVTIYFRVRAVNSAGGTSGWSSTASVNNTF